MVLCLGSTLGLVNNLKQLLKITVIPEVLPSCAGFYFLARPFSTRQ